MFSVVSGIDDRHADGQPPPAFADTARANAAQNRQPASNPVAQQEANSLARGETAGNRGGLDGPNSAPPRKHHGEAVECRKERNPGQKFEGAQGAVATALSAND